MSATPVADDAAETILGEHDAEDLCWTLKKVCGSGDELFALIDRHRDRPARLRGLCRRLQRRLQLAR
jgi:hypothetical protein